MEGIIGAIASGMTICSLFKACIEAFDLIQTARKQEEDLRKLKLKLNIEKCRLYTWGEAMGLVDYEPDQRRPIDSFQFRELVAESLRSIVELFENADKIRDRYGCRERSTDTLCQNEESRYDRLLSASFANFRLSTRSGKAPRRFIKKVRWVIYDSKKFDDFISEIRILIDSLKDITSYIATGAKQEKVVERGILTIKDVDVLEAISEVCEVDHPNLSSVVSEFVNSISAGNSEAVAIEAWSSNVEAVVDCEISDIESLSITELKDRYYRLVQGKRALELFVSQFSASDFIASQLIHSQSTSDPTYSSPPHDVSITRIMELESSAPHRPLPELEGSTPSLPATMVKIDPTQAPKPQNADSDLRHTCQHSTSPSREHTIETPPSERHSSDASILEVLTAKTPPKTYSDTRPGAYVGCSSLMGWRDRYNHGPPWYTNVIIEAHALSSDLRGDCRFFAEAELIASGGFHLQGSRALDIPGWPCDIRFSISVGPTTVNAVMASHLDRRGFHVFKFEESIREGQLTQFAGFACRCLNDENGYWVGRFYIRHLFLLPGAALSKIQCVRSLVDRVDPGDYFMIVLYGWAFGL